MNNESSGESKPDATSVVKTRRLRRMESALRAGREFEAANRSRDSVPSGSFDAVGRVLHANPKRSYSMWWPFVMHFSERGAPALRVLF